LNMGKDNKAFKCPNCGCTNYTEYDHTLRNGLIASGVRVLLLGPLSVLLVPLGAGENSTGKKCNNCGKKVANKRSDSNRRMLKASSECLSEQLAKK
ncbi:MAG: LITAF-like zinc ribbon domain-containing protein, partial [Ruminococcus sp.]|nr:LITAF-like zinc ribbon domain-containing protein [Ruminococcus sp.]